MHILIEKLKNKVIELKNKGVNDDTIRIYVKEILQDYVLGAIYSNPIGNDFVFIGGTALRKLYNLNRLSEDLDFVTDSEVSMHEMSDLVLEYFKKIGFTSIDCSTQGGDKIYRITAKFQVLNDIGLSGYQNEKLHIKIEYTKNKVYEKKYIPKVLANNSVIITTYPLETLMVGKILACLERVYLKGSSDIQIKGRDYFDLIWYMQEGVIPNEKILLEYNSKYSLKNVFELLDTKVEKIKYDDLITDLGVFFEDKYYIENWSRNFHSFYKEFRKKY